MIDAILKTGNPWLIAGMLGVMAGGIWVNFGYMRKNMVTKKDLTIGLGFFYKEMEEKFVTRRECEVMMKSRPNGQAKHSSL